MLIFIECSYRLFKVILCAICTISPFRVVSSILSFHFHSIILYPVFSNPHDFVFFHSFLKLFLFLMSFHILSLYYGELLLFAWGDPFMVTCAHLRHLTTRSFQPSSSSSGEFPLPRGMRLLICLISHLLHWDQASNRSQSFLGHSSPHYYSRSRVKDSPLALRDLLSPSSVDVLS